MTKSELIELITAKQKHLPAKDVELALKQMLEIMSDALAAGERIEIRGFGSFSLHFRPPRQACSALQGRQRPARARQRRYRPPDPRLNPAARRYAHRAHFWPFATD
jgi:nucleoid DNA-binding protein